MNWEQAREHTARFVDAAERSIQARIGEYVDREGVRRDLEKLAILSWESCTKRRERDTEQRVRRRA